MSTSFIWTWLKRQLLSLGLAALLANFTPGQLGRWAGADVLFSLFSDHSWGLFTVAMVTFISIAAELLFLRGK